jgi:predicted ester cyclase
MRSSSAATLALSDELFTKRMAPRARRWFGPFRASFPDVSMETVQLVTEGDTVVGGFRCSGTHLGAWSGHEPTGRRFERVDEVVFFRFEAGRIAERWGLEDTGSRLRQLGLASG